MTLRQDVRYALIWADVHDAARFRYLLTKKQWTDAERRELRGRLVKYHLPNRNLPKIPKNRIRGN